MPHRPADARGHHRATSSGVVVALALASLSVAGCAQLKPCPGRTVKAGDALECPMPGWTDRAFDLRVPSEWDGSSPLPVVVAFHGGGGNRRATLRTTCPDGDTDDPRCLAPLASQAGFLLVAPNGTGSRPLRNLRTWNAGGGHDGFNCTSGGACKSGVDDVRYFDELIAEVGRVVPVDPQRIHLTGLSNGGAISHRIACERPGRVASIAAVGGANQHALTGGGCAEPVPVLQIHGTEDPCWTWERSSKACIGSEKGVKVGVEETMEDWRVRNGCGTPPSEEALDDLSDDGTRVVRSSWPGCSAATELLRIEGGGHSWPGGYAYLGEGTIGRVCQDVSASELILEFFRAHPKR